MATTDRNKYMDNYSVMQQLKYLIDGPLDLTETDINISFINSFLPPNVWG